jgi:hypothetical protein
MLIGISSRPGIQIIRNCPGSAFDDSLSLKNIDLILAVSTELFSILTILGLWMIVPSIAADCILPHMRIIEDNCISVES